jgi:hypothetical protein
VPDSSAPTPLSDPKVLVLDAKGREGASMLDLGERVRWTHSFVCDTFMHIMFTLMHFDICDICVIVRLM